MTKKELQEMEKRFWQLYEEALKQAEELCADRMASYVGDETILEYWIHGSQDLIYEINKKMLRLRRQHKAGEQGDTIDGVVDTLLDMINYAGFLLAFLRLQHERNLLSSTRSR